MTSQDNLHRIAWNVTKIFRNKKRTEPYQYQLAKEWCSKMSESLRERKCGDGAETRNKGEGGGGGGKGERKLTSHWKLLNSFGHGYNVSSPLFTNSCTQVTGMQGLLIKRVTVWWSFSNVCDFSPELVCSCLEEWKRLGQRYRGSHPRTCRRRKYEKISWLLTIIGLENQLTQPHLQYRRSTLYQFGRQQCANRVSSNQKWWTVIAEISTHLKIPYTSASKF